MKLTKEQFNEQYGEAKVIFTYYYKYSFNYEGMFEGKKIYVSEGGSADDIYRQEVVPNKKYQVKELGINYATVKEGETTIAEFTGGW
jgi:hypothetical protein